MRAGICTLPCAIFKTLRNDLFVDVDYTIRVELINLRTDLGTDPVTAACRLIDYNLQSLNHSDIFSWFLSNAAAARSSGTGAQTRTLDRPAAAFEFLSISHR